MQKALRQFGIVALLFFGAWLLLGRIPFVRIFNVEELTRENERKVGAFILQSATVGHRELGSGFVQKSLDSIKTRLCAATAVPDSSITIHVLVSEEVNAYALPDGHIIVSTALIDYCRTPEELSGVLAHEIAHIQRKHVMKKLTKEVGLAMLAAMAGGQSGGEIGRETARMLSSSAFDRTQESEADAGAVKLLASAGIDPEALANFLFRLSQEKEKFPRQLELLSTHPNSQDRAAEILRLRANETIHVRQVLAEPSWSSLHEIASSATDTSSRD